MTYHKQIDNLELALNADLSSSALTVTVIGDLTIVQSRLPIYAYIEMEKIEITGVAGQDLTIVRGVDGTTAVAHSNGSLIEGNVVCENVNELIDGKVDKIVGKDLSTNDFTNLDKANLDTAYQHSQSAHAPSNANYYVHPTTHPISMIENLQTSLDGKVDKSILTSKGDIFINNGTSIVRLPVGSNGQVLVADSTQPNGVKWVTNPNVYGTEFEYLSNNSSLTTSLEVWQDYMVLSTQSKPIGIYKISYHLIGHGLSTSYDFMVRVTIDDVQINDIFQKESQDSGTDQRNYITGFGFVDFGIASTHSIKIQIASSRSGYDVTAYTGVIEIKRVA